MTNAKAQAAKEKGNTAFKAGDYANAVGQYTEAILTDRTDPTLPLNRAAAYLKLGKNEDADRDCSAVLKLSSSNVKALFRRGQARSALGRLLDAQRDLNSALRLEPNNTSIQDELKKVEQAIALEKSKKSKLESARASFASPSPPSSSTSTGPPPRRRCVPIQIIEPASERQTTRGHAPDAETKLATETKQDSTILVALSKPDVKEDLMTPITSRTLEPSRNLKTVSPSSTVTPKPPASFADAKEARESVRTSRVGGGIFRANGRNTVFPANDRTSATSPVSVPQPQTTDNGLRTSKSPTRTGLATYPVNIPKNSGAMPSTMSMFGFNKTWEANQSVEERWELITSIPPENIPSMCKASLEPVLLISVIDVFIEVLKANAGDQATMDAVRVYLTGFENVPRFSTILLFLSEKEKVRVREVWKLLGSETLGGAWSLLSR
ncbi:hypothetical protein F5887DRAFT_564238 [Amanita rubescens]|nr:hypothetical protein F5887DRAFT_685923 [Amanita rubescens]KAF8336711.1 hypothetical protein F5887DRAFT_564238 [Amanita rubescens]